MPNHGTPLTAKNLKKFSGTVTLNLPEIDDELAKDFGSNGDAVAMILEESLTRDNLEQKLIALGKRQKPQPILNFVTRRTLPARNAKFDPKKSYVVNVGSGLPTPALGTVKISYVDQEYLQLCGDAVYDAAPETTLCSHILTRPSAFAPAVKELNGRGIEARITPVEQFSLMEQQPDGPKSPAGLLLANGYANLLEVVFPNGETRLVNLYWYDDGWNVYVYSVSHSLQWRDGRQLLSCNFRDTVVA